SEARDEAAQVAGRFEESLNRETRIIRTYKFPPQPGTFEFDSDASLDELRKQTNLDERTSSGLPVAVLAAFEVAKRSMSIRDGELAFSLALKRWPDLTSPRILKSLAALANENDWQGNFQDWEKAWQTDEIAREIIRRSESPGWRASDGKLYQIQDVGNGEFSFLSLSQDSPTWQDGKNYAIRLSTPDLALGKNGKVVFEQSLGLAKLRVGVLDSEALEAEWRIRRNGTLLVLGFSAFVITGGMLLMTRGLMKEKKAAHARSQFVASVTHELRAPVGAMRLISDALTKGKLAPDKVSEFNQLLSRESSRLSVLIENIMDLARVEDGQRVLRKEELDFADIAEEVSEMMTMQAREAGITLKTKGSALSANADPVLLCQVLVNLLDNAIKFSPSGSVVTVSWGEGWSFTVADQGPGIPEEQRGQIFERFYRLEDELRRETKGVGIGLSLVKELTELHGGSVSVSNQGGAIFKVSFPNS
ncbi:HAMP domain-containing histidine kinase, partial [Akkermansiaceae bacterium]|nr:HAMP domain-containing histidine kinase [Akkermansiaceae bacterium]